MILGGFLLVVAGETHSESVSDQLLIRAQVAPILEYRIAREPSVLEIKKVDLKKGYTDIKDNVVLYVTSNNIDGYYLSISTQDTALFTSITVTTRDKSVAELYPGESLELHMPFQPSEVKHKLDFRFNLAADAEVGVYEWPITVTIYPV